MLLLTSSIGSVLTSSLDRAGGDGVKLSLSVDDPKLPPQLPFVVKLIVSFKLLLLLFRTLLFVLSVLLLFPKKVLKLVLRNHGNRFTKPTVRGLHIHAISIFNVRRDVVDVLDVGREVGCSDLRHMVDDV